jgi:HAD superfamily hydrolase (TIGR01490 family)
MKVTRLIVFDLDHTLLIANSSFRFGFYLYRQNFFSFWILILCLCDYARHKWWGMSIQDLHTKAFERLFKGCALEDILQHVDKFLTKDLNSMLYAPAVRRLKDAQERGDRVIILSSSPDFLVGEIAQRLGVKLWKATHYQEDENGMLIMISHVMEGEDKANYVQVLAEQFLIPLSSITVYSDSYLDLPVLKIAGQAIGVVPDYRLKRVCLQNGWEIL